MTDSPPKIDNAPGLAWSRRKAGWEGRWRARGDLVKRGYQTRSVPLWVGTEPTPSQAAYICDQCKRLQTEMLIWANGGLPVAAQYNGTLRSLIACYQTDPDSRYHALRYQTRRNYDALCARIINDHGDELVRDITARLMLRWHEQWSADGKIPMGHAMMGMLRTLIAFGALFLEEKEDSPKECTKAKAVLHAMKFKMAPARGERITADQADAVRAQAHAMGLHSLAFAQALQFEGTLRQKDVIGEWVPQSEPELSVVTAGNEKWLRGLRWSEIDADLILRHTTSKRQKKVEINLTLAPMVMEELARFGDRPTSGPVIVYERTGLPYTSYQFRYEWRRVARAAGVPDAVFNMDSRAGAISEALLAGAELDHVRHAATHSNITTTQGYDRIAIEATAEVMRTRAASRNKK